MMRTALGLLAVGAIPTVMLVAAGPTLFSLVFGPEWSEAGRIAIAMTPWFLAGFVVSPISRIVFVFERQGIKLIYDALTLALTIGVYFWSEATNADLISLIWMFSVLNAFSYVVYYSLLVHVIRKGPLPA